MHKYFKLILPAFAVLFLFGASAVDSFGQDILRQIMKRMDENNKALTSVKSTIKMNKFNSQLAENDLYEGDLNYRPGRSEKEIFVRINWAKPVVEHLAVANGQYVLYRPRTKQAIVGKVDGVKNENSKAGGALAFMTMSKAQLSQNYHVEYKGEESVQGGVVTWHLLLTPKTAATYKSADLWVNKDGMPVQAKIVEKNNDSTTVLLQGIVRNATVKASDFKISPPKGVKIIQG